MNQITNIQPLDAEAKQRTEDKQQAEESTEAKQQAEESTEERILRAAEREFLRKGYAGARTTAIAEAAGVTHAMLHYYFRTKENLFSHIVTKKVALLSQAFALSLGDDDEPFADSLARAMTIHFNFLRANPDLPRFMVSEVFGNQELLDMLKQRLIRVASEIVPRLQQKIDAAAARGECRRLPARDIILDVISLNILPILGLPMISNMLGFFPGANDVDAILDMRLQNNIEVIMNKIKP